MNAAQSNPVDPAAADPGLSGAVPFTFACSRCGHCCSGGAGHVWLEDEEVAPLAAALGATPEAFARHHLRRAVDPAGGRARLALRERADGRCTLLAGRNTCTAYAVRPAQCRAFPYWPAVLAGGAAFEQARATCPGIAVRVPAAVRVRAFAALEELYGRVAAEEAPLAGSGREKPCCLAPETPEDLYVSALEADHAAARGAPDAGCRLGRARPLGCRLRARPSERWRGALRAIEREHGYPAAYGEARALYRARGVDCGGEAR